MRGFRAGLKIFAVPFSDPAPTWQDDFQRPAKIELREPPPRHSDATGAFRCALQFNHPDWIFEPKLDGFRAVAYV